MPSDPRIDDYLERVRRRLRHLSAQRRNVELAELRAHLDTLVRDRLLRGLALDEAVNGALLAFGPADKLGRGLARTGPRPRRLPRALLSGLMIALGVGAAVANALPAPWTAIEASLKVANEFMAHGKAGDVKAASALYSLPERWFAGSPRKLSTLFRERQTVFANFESLERENYGATVRWGTQVIIDGKITLTDGTLVPFEASFVNAAGNWKVQRFDLK